MSLHPLMQRALAPWSPRDQAAVDAAGRDAAIEKEVSPTTVTYRVKGEFEAVWRACYTLLAKYPAQGYDTKIKSLQRMAGVWEATVERRSSCE